MNLAIFDVDRTLVFTRWPDGHGFVRALTDVTGVADVSWDWGTYRYSSDNGILDEIFERHIGRPPTDDEVARIRQRFLEVLGEHAARDPEFVVEVPGAAAFVAALRASDAWAVALATGGWRVAAHRKLELAGFAVADLPGAYADDAWGRTAIVSLARARAEAAHGPFGRVVSMGDAPWDVRAARSLELPFCGIGDTAERRAALERAGARTVITDYTDPVRAHRALGDAAPPAAGDDGLRPAHAD